MRWPDLDLETGWWTIPGGATKNKLTHRVPLVPRAVNLLRALPMDVSEENKEQWVFVGRFGREPLTDAKKVAPRIIERVLEARTTAGEKHRSFHFTAHDLRRTVATKLAEGGVSRFVISRILNHVEPGVTKVYDRYTYDAEKRAALTWWSAKLDAILGSEVGHILFAVGNCAGYEDGLKFVVLQFLR
jgi:integrase